MVNCAAFGCGHRSEKHKNINFFRFPAIITSQCQKTRELSERRRRTWLSQVNRADLTLGNLSPHARVCSSHFINGRPFKLWEETDPDWIPSRNLGYQHRSEGSLERFQRSQKRLKLTLQTQDTEIFNEQEIIIEDNTDASDVTSGCHVEIQVERCSQMDTSVQTDITMSMLSELETDLLHKNKELYSLRDENSNRSMGEDSFKDDDEKVKFYTGLTSFSVLMTLFRFVTEYISISHRNKLSKFEEFIIVLMRLRLNLLLVDLGYRFGLSASSVARIFEKWLEVLYVRLQDLIIWPDRDTLHASMPLSFKLAFGKNVALILDCFEVFIDRPSSLDTRAATWSQYKSHNTVKFFNRHHTSGNYGISFISEAWGGRTSDKYLTENSGVLNKLSPGDVVLADRGFTIADSVGFACAKLHIPAFTKGKSQLSALEVSETRKLASLRIHVERVIGLVRNKYKILQSQLPVELLSNRSGQNKTTIDKIVCVCCALTNMVTSVVPLD